MRIGTISDHINAKTVVLFVIQFVVVVALLGYKGWRESSAECVRCHADKEKMGQLGYPDLYVTQEMVEKQSKHAHVKCHECHLGDGRAREADEAHRGMLSALLIDDNGEILKRKPLFRSALIPRGDDRIRQMLPEPQSREGAGPPAEVRNVLWHDRDRETLNFDPKIAEKTCGKSGCHPEELKQFRRTIMATNFRQRTMRTWIEPYGPHNCGPSFADLPPAEVLTSAGFSFTNTERIAGEINLPFSREQAAAKQKFCNVCHAGCLDCHYEPDGEKGVHHFTGKPKPETCMGYGRGTSICHPGSMHSRRGSTYIGGDYSIPVGMEPDVHYKKRINCIECHTTGEKGMGDMQRKAHCQDCHLEIEEAHGKSIHRNLDCATCHVNELRGYQIVIWGPGLVAGKENPFKKYSLYYGIQKPPVLVKDQKGIWMPVKVFPHSLGNAKAEVQPSEKMVFRWPRGETRDPYYVVGTFDAPSHNRHLLWIELQTASHPYGKGRDCESCHREQQVASSTWEYMDDQGASEPFDGGYRIVADRNGLKITDMTHGTAIKAAPDYTLEDFASWVYFRDLWKMPGDFSIPSEKEKYAKYLDASKKISAALSPLDAAVKTAEKKAVKSYKALKGVVLHREDDALELIREFKSTHGL